MPDPRLQHSRDGAAATVARVKAGAHSPGRYREKHTFEVTS